jgi:transposase, IS6 family
VTKPWPAEFNWRRFEAPLILMAVGWYLRFSLSFAMLKNSCGSEYVGGPGHNLALGSALRSGTGLRSHLKPTNKSWRVDETYIRVKGKWAYLYRAVDSAGASIDVLLSAQRDAAAAKRFFQKALRSSNHPTRVINADKNPSYPPVVEALKAEGTLRQRCRLRPVQHLNNILEQDHRAIKRRVKASQGLRSFRGADRTIQGYEAAHAIRKGQVRWLGSGQIVRQLQFIVGLFQIKMCCDAGRTPLLCRRLKVATLPRSRKSSSTSR